MEYSGYCAQTRKGQLCPAQNTVKASCKLSSKYLYGTPCNVPTFITATAPTTQGAVYPHS